MLPMVGPFDETLKAGLVPQHDKNRIAQYVRCYSLITHCMLLIDHYYHLKLRR